MISNYRSNIRTALRRTSVIVTTTVATYGAIALVAAHHPAVIAGALWMDRIQFRF